MTKLTLTRIYTTDKDKSGIPFKSKKGFPYTKMSLKATEYGDKWISGFKGKENENWKDGDVVEVEITQNGEYLNFSVPKATNVLGSDELSKIHNLLTGMNLVLLQVATKVGLNTYSPDGKYPNEKHISDDGYPDEDIDIKDITF